MGLEKLGRKANKDIGRNVVSKGGAIDEGLRWSTGSLSLDAELGGGLTVGRIITVAGEFSDGKTAVVAKAVAEYQKAFPHKEVLWVDAEGVWERNWSSTLGIDVDNVYVMQPDYAQQAFDFINDAIDENVGLVVIDSIAALVPKEEAEKGMEDWQMGLQARINKKFLRKAQSALHAYKASDEADVPPTIIAINQLYASMSMYGGQKEGGGDGLNYYASIKIRLKRGDVFPSSKGRADEGVEPKAQAIHFHVSKNKTAAPFRRGHFWFYFDTLDKYRTKGCYDVLEEVIRYAMKYGIVERVNKKMYRIVDPWSGEVHSLTGAKGVAQFIRSNPKIQDWIKEETIKIVKEGMLKDDTRTQQPEEDETVQEEPEVQRIDRDEDVDEAA